MFDAAQRINAKDLFGPLATFSSVMAADTGYEYHWHWPKEIGTGYLSMIKFRPGLILAVGNYHLFKKIEVDFSMENPFWVLVCNISEGQDSSAAGKAGPDWNYRPGRISILRRPECNGTVRLPVCSHIGTVSIYLTPELLQSFLDKHERTSPFDAQIIFEIDRPFSLSLEMPPNVNTVINQILNCPYQGAMSRIYLEGKTLELLTYSLSRFFEPECVWKRSSSFSDDEVRQIHRAKELIGQDLQNPPKLQELAAEVGLSHTKLSKYFREMFGTTIFGYLREMRLNRAKSLLDNGYMNVTEVAYEVGYSSLSHFAKSFKEFHGTLPGTYMRKAESAPEELGPSSKQVEKRRFIHMTQQSIVLGMDEIVPAGKHHFCEA